MTASTQHPIAPAFTSTNTAYTTLESLLLFQNLTTHGTHPSSFSAISNLLVKNPLVRESESFDRGRLSPDALREFFHYLLRRETDEAGGKGVVNGNAGGAGEGVDTMHFARQMKDRFYAEYRELMRRLIKADEERFARLADEIQEIEAGKWDERLAMTMDWSNLKTTPPTSTSKLVEPPTTEISQPLEPVKPSSPSLSTVPPNVQPIPQGQIQAPLPSTPRPPSLPKSQAPVQVPSELSQSQVPSLQHGPPLQPAQAFPQTPPPQQSPPLSTQLQQPLHQLPQPPQPPQQIQMQQPGTSSNQPHVLRPAPIQPAPPRPPQSPQRMAPPTVTPTRQHFQQGGGPPYSPIASVQHGSPTSPLPNHTYSSPPFQQYQGQIQRQTLPPPVPHPQSPYRMATYGQHGHPLPPPGASLPQQYQQGIPPLAPRPSNQDLHRIQQYQNTHQQPPQQIQFSPIQPQQQQSQVQQSQQQQKQQAQSQKHDQQMPLAQGSPVKSPARLPISSGPPPQIPPTQLQPQPQNFVPPVSGILPASTPKHRPPPILTGPVTAHAQPKSEKPVAPIQAPRIVPIAIPFPRPKTPPVLQQQQSPLPTTPSRPGSPIQPGPEDISPISSRGPSPTPPEEIDSERSRKRALEERGDRPAEMLKEEEEEPAAKRRKSVGGIPSAPIPTIAKASASDRTAAARAASAAKRAAASRRGGRGGRRSSIGAPSQPPPESLEPDVKKERASDAEEIEDDESLGHEEVEDAMEKEDKKKPLRKVVRGKKRRGLPGRRRHSLRKGTAAGEEDGTADEGGTSAVESEVPVPSVDEDIVSEMDVDATPTPKSRGQPQKRKRQASTPPPPSAEVAIPVPTGSPRLSSATPLPAQSSLLPPPPLPQPPKSEISSTSSSELSNLVLPSPSPVFPPQKPTTTVGQQVQVIATKKFLQLSTPLLHNISAHRFANLFMAPLNERVAPGYSRLVFQPTDLKTIKAAIKHGAAAVNHLTAAAATNPTTEPTTPSTPSSTVAGGPPATPTTILATGYSSHPATTSITPPKGIVNSAQLEKELFRMFANAVMYNKSNSEIVKETVEMGKEVERWVGEFRSAERVGGERARGVGGLFPGASAPGSVTGGGYRGSGGRHSLAGSGALPKAESSGSAMAAVAPSTSRRGRSKRPKPDEGEEDVEEDGGDDGEKAEDDEEGEEAEEEGVADEDGDEDISSVPGTIETADEDDDAASSVAGSNSVLGGRTSSRRGGRGGARGGGAVGRGRAVKRGKRRR